MSPLVFCWSCVTPAALPTPTKFDVHAVFSNSAWESSSDLAITPTEEEILAVDTDMRDFLQRHVNLKSSDEARLRELLKGMLDEGYLALDYQFDSTYTASQTFALKRGNCLSFTNLFVALAREVDLDVKFQLVDIPPRWHSNESWVVFDKHINTVLPRLRVNGIYTRDYVVDFNIADYLGNYDQTVVNDTQAIALMYNNLGVDKMRKNRPREAMALFHKAYNLSEKLPGLWINIGVLHARTGKLDKAEVALQQALKLEKSNPAALSNLASLYEARGELGKMQLVEEWMRFYRDKNPYYYFQLAQRAYVEERHRDALALADQAIRIKRDEHQFHYLRALIQQKNGNLESARNSLDLALRHSMQLHKVHKAYQEKMNLLLPQ
ncbi:MAG: tetratricopeptide repeat protein [Oceanococcus sp.]